MGDDNSTTIQFGGGYALPIGTPTDKPIYNAGAVDPYLEHLVNPAVTLIAVAAIAFGILLMIGGRR